MNANSHSERVQSGREVAEFKSDLKPIGEGEMQSTPLTIDRYFRHFDAQKVLFSAKPSRRNLLSVDCSDDDQQRITVNVWRNHAFETVASLVPPYLALRNTAIDFHLGAYDESFSFAGHNQANLELMWIDSRGLMPNLGFNGWLSWLQGRLIELRVLTNAPIVVATWLDGKEQSHEMQSLANAIPGVYFADLQATADLHEVELLDERAAELAGTSIGNRAQVVIARELACHWLPPLILPPVKALALDLDNTLHLGVLGEDGVDGVRLTSGHERLQRFLKELKSRGVFLALVSRNELVDVKRLFEERADYPLRIDDFSVVEVSWADKALAISRVAHALRISTGSVLFVDDNIGELGNVVQQVPDVLAIHASDDGDATCRAIDFFPGLWRWRVGEDDVKRIADLKANESRSRLAQVSQDPDEYFRSLRVTLTYRTNPSKQIQRLAELCRKTNQFNLSLRRLNEADLSNYLSDDDADIVSVQLSDRLSDSGVIAVVVAKRVSGRLNVVEVCVSCRAMGRQLEDSIVILAISKMPNFSLCNEVSFNVQDGPRNQPAREWLGSLLGLNRLADAGIQFAPVDVIKSFERPKGVNIIWDSEDNI